MFESAAPLRAEFHDLETALGDPAVHADLARARRVGRRYAELVPIVKALDEYDRINDDLAAAKELAAEDHSLAIEAAELEAQLVPLTDRLTRLLAPRDPNDSSDALMEIKSGEGGEESALFAADLLKMYSRYAENRGWKVEVLDAQETDLGGYKSATIAIKAPRAADPDSMPYGVLKFEGGVHRVQRVPITESQGRVHTSAAGVLVMPEVAETEIEINEDDLRIDVYRSSGPGGQGVNTTDSAVRITHLPTGIVVSCQNEKSQLQNKAAALRVLQSRLLEKARQDRETEMNALKGDGSNSWGSQMRSYVLHPYQMVKDLRTDYEVSSPDAVFDGEIDGFIESGIRWRRMGAAS